MHKDFDEPTTDLEDRIIDSFGEDIEPGTVITALGRVLLELSVRLAKVTGEWDDVKDGLSGMFDKILTGYDAIRDKEMP